MLNKCIENNVKERDILSLMKMLPKHQILFAVLCGIASGVYIYKDGVKQYGERLKEEQIKLKEVEKTES